METTKTQQEFTMQTAPQKEHHWLQMTSHVLGDDGQWSQFMTVRYWRKHQ